MRVPRPRPGLPTRAAAVAIALLAVAGAPAVALAHGLSPVYQSPLPLGVYLAGAAVTVALSFAFVLARDIRAAPPPPPRVARVPGVARVLLRLVGLAGWAWIMAQGLLGGSSDAAVAGLFLWVYGWVGIALLSALVFPLWEWLDPFTTLHDVGAWVLRRAGVRGWEPSPMPRRLRLWPAVAGFAFVVWLELAADPGGTELTVVLAGYTVLTLALMAQYGRDTWRNQGETFSVWFRTLNRLAAIGVAPLAITDPTAARGRADGTDATDARAVLRRPFASGLLEVRWEIPRIILVAIGTGSIIYDGLSQTVPFLSVFGVPSLAEDTLLLAGFLGLIAAGAVWVARSVSPGAIGAGLLPIAVGYLFAHYLTWILIDGQRIVIAVSDPFQQGWDLMGTAFYEPQAGWLPPGLVWTLQLAAVVGGHMLGAWAGHVSAQRDMDAQLAHAGPARGGANGNGNGAGRDLRHRKIHDPEPLPTPRRNVRAREVPLAVLMVALTTITLWSLGQAIVVDEVPEARAAATSPG